MEPTDEELLDMNIQTECKYHLLLNRLYECVYGRFEQYYDWAFFDYWIGDESHFDNIYREVFMVIFAAFFHETLTQEQIELIRKKGRNLEETITKWLHKWKVTHPDMPNEKMPISCVKHKIYEYIAYQLKQRDMRQLVGSPC